MVEVRLPVGVPRSAAMVAAGASDATQASAAAAARVPRDVIRVSFFGFRLPEQSAGVAPIARVVRDRSCVGQPGGAGRLCVASERLQPWPSLSLNATSTV